MLPGYRLTGGIVKREGKEDDVRIEEVGAQGNNTFNGKWTVFL